MFGTENIKIALAAVLDSANAAGQVYQDKKIGIADLPYIYEAAKSMTALYTLDFSEMKKEIGDLSAEEKRELIDFMKIKFDLPQDNIEEVAESIIELAFEQYVLVQKAIALLKL